MTANINWVGAAIGPYRILRKLGEGGMGAVYEAMHETIERRVAIKILHAEYARNSDVTHRFFNEARAVNRIAHPSLVQISDYGQLTDGTGYIVMEYLGGETLGHRLKRLGGRLAPPQVLSLGWQIATALTAAHDKNIVHRDLKPDNIMLVPDQLVPGGERAKLLDFGIAKLAADSKSTQARTRTDIIMGTPSYMSPEQCRGAGVVDAKTDVYSLGVMLYQMLAGRPPFVAEGHGELIAQHLFGRPPPLSEFAPHAPAPLVALIMQLLVKDRNERPTMSQVAHELERIGAQLVTGALPTSPPTSAQPSYAQPPLVLPQQNSTLNRSVGQVSRSMSLRKVRLLLAAGASLGVAICAAWMIRSTYLLPQRLTTAASPGVSRPLDRERSAPAEKPVAEVPANAAEATEPTQASPLTPPSSAGAGQRSAPPEVVRWSLVTTPPGASVVQAKSGEVLGTTPWHAEQAKADVALKLRIEHPGFIDKVVVFDGNRSMERKEKLERISTSLTASVPASASERSRPVTVAPKPPNVNPNAEPAKPRFRVIN